MDEESQKEKIIELKNRVLTAADTVTWQKTVTIPNEIVVDLPPPHPLQPNYHRLYNEPVRYGVRMVALYFVYFQAPRKLPKFEGKTLEYEKYSFSEKEKLLKLIPAEVSLFPTLKKHLTQELHGAQIVYERIYSDSLPTLKKQSLFFTQIFKVKALMEPDSSSFLSEESVTPPVFECDLVPYYAGKSENDKTLIFESRFESGNLCLVLKVD